VKIHSSVLYLLSGQGGEVLVPGDLEDQGQGHSHLLGSLAPMRYTFGVNLVIIHSAVLYLLAGQGVELDMVPR
jgi:hypothetical protein